MKNGVYICNVNRKTLTHRNLIIHILNFTIMAKKINKTESKNNVANLKASANKWLINRTSRILENVYMDENTADEMIKMIEEWKSTAKERELKKIEDEIARLTALKEELSK